MKKRRNIIYQVADIGTVRIVRSRAARNISLSVGDKILRVTCPRWLPVSKALAFVQERELWIAEQRALMKSRREELLSRGIDYDAINHREARLLLTSRLQELGTRHNFSWRRVTIRNQQARWGSCTSLGDISLNRKLAALPEELRDYVILHELLHTTIHDHSPHFWSELDKLVENSQQLRSELKQYGPY
jgi:predicted metal-dependent hydrolase